MRCGFERDGGWDVYTICVFMDVIVAFVVPTTPHWFGNVCIGLYCAGGEFSFPNMDQSWACKKTFLRAMKIHYREEKERNTTLIGLLPIVIDLADRSS